MKRIVWMVALAAACGGKKDQQSASGSSSASGSASASATASSSVPAKQARAKVSPVCDKARDFFGYYAECVETELPELASPAGKIVRVMAKDDPTADYVFALVAPNGDITIDHGTTFGIGDELVKKLDLASTPPDLIAKIYAELDDQPAIVRCLPGANDTLPDGKPCRPPTADKNKDGKPIIRAIIEELSDPRGLSRDEHWIQDAQLSVEDGHISELEGDSIATLDVNAPRPASFPPMPTMTSPPDWVAKPEEAPAATGDALCKAQQEKVSGWAGRHCKAYGYPSLGLPNGTLYYLANDAGVRYAWAFQKPDNTIVVGSDLDEQSPLAEIVKDYDPAKVPPEKLVAAELLLNTHPAKLRCLGGDKIDGVDCKPPTATKTADGVHAEAIIEDLGLPDEHGSVDDPSIRDATWDFAGGGYSGDSTRLVDLRETE